jgi:hypothetical protein
VTQPPPFDVDAFLAQPLTARADPSIAIVIDVCDLATGLVQQVIARGRAEILLDHPAKGRRGQVGPTPPPRGSTTGLEGDGGSGARAVRSVRCRTRSFRADFDELRPRQEIAAEVSLTENGTAQLLLLARWALESALDPRV